MKENRKFIRAKIPHDIIEWNKLLGAKAYWPSHEQVDVFDLAYKGAAIGAPALFEIEVNQKLPLKFSLNPYGDIGVNCRVAWKTENKIGLEFEDMTAGAKRTLDQYLDMKIIGQNLKPVDRKHFNPSVDFTDWYTGPSNVHVFLWRDSSSHIEKAKIESEFGSVEFDGVRWNSSDKDFLIKISDILSQIPQTEHPLKELAKTLPKSL